MPNRELSIHRNDEKIAYLFDQGADDWQLLYCAAEVNQRVSVRFPVREQAYQSKDVRAFMRNLLPGVELCRSAARLLGITPGNDLALISELCRETVGALRFYPSGNDLQGGGALRPLSDAELRNLFAVLPIDPLLTQIEGYRGSLPGEHHKLRVHVVNDEISLPLGATLSTHIVKPAYDDRRESLENESFCTALASALGLPVVELDFVRAPSNYLLIKRFDRSWDDGQIKCLHAEDFCQLALLQPENAFQREGGLSPADCVDLLRAYSIQPGVDIKYFIYWVIFNFLIGNGSANAKQLALVHSQEGPKLAPFYGLSCSHVYPTMNQNMGLHLGHEARPDWMIPARWREFAISAGVRPKYVLALLESLSAELIALVPQVEARWQQVNGYAGITGSIRKLIERRARQIVVSLQAEAA